MTCSLKNIFILNLGSVVARMVLCITE